MRTLRTTTPSPSPSINNYIDVALLRKKRVALTVSEDEYMRLTAALGPILDDDRILLLGNKNIEKYFIKGFGSVYQKLTHKFTSKKLNNCNGVLVCLFVGSQKTVKYYRLIKTYKLSKSSTYQKTLDTLNRAGYEQVSRVEDINQFCIKGGIIDIYSPLYSRPLRMCLYEGEESIKFYNLESGLSEDSELESLSLNKAGKSIESISVDSFLKEAGFSIQKTPSTLMNNVQIINYTELHRTQAHKKVVYSDKIYFSSFLRALCFKI